MNLAEHRDSIAQVAIVLTVCIGGWLMLVKPKAEEVARLQRIIDEQSALSAGGVNQQSIEAAAMRVQNIRTRLSQIESYGRLADDSSRFYGLVMNLAEAHQVQVHGLQPSVAKPISGGAANAASVHLRLSGPYENVAEFLHAVVDIEAFIRPTSLHIAPSRSLPAPSVEAEFGCELLSFATTTVETLGSGGGSDAQR
jgi:Tfp pilus assembly protein PilO